MINMYEEEREITPELLSELSRTLTEKSRNVIETITNLMEVRERVREILKDLGALIKLEKSVRKKIIGYAIDSSFVQVLPLVVGDFFIVTAGYIRYPRLQTKDKTKNAGLKVGVRITNNISSSLRAISAYAHIIERKIGLDLVKKESDINAILIDGPIIPLYLYYIPESRLYDEEKQLINITEKLIRSSEIKGITLIGVVKRVRSRFISKGFKRLLEPSLKDKFNKLLEVANDKSLGSLVLDNSEALIFGRPIGTTPAYESIVTEEEYGGIADRFIKSHPWAQKMDFAILKPKRSRQVISVEALDYAKIGFEDILTWINAHATHTGCPQILDYVDRYVQISSGLVEIARRLLIKIIAEKIKEEKQFKEFEIIELLLDYADLQKKYAPRMG